MVGVVVVVVVVVVCAAVQVGWRGVPRRNWQPFQFQFQWFEAGRQESSMTKPFRYLLPGRLVRPYHASVAKER